MTKTEALASCRLAQDRGRTTIRRLTMHGWRTRFAGETHPIPTDDDWRRHQLEQAIQWAAVWRNATDRAARDVAEWATAELVRMDADERRDGG